MSKLNIDQKNIKTLFQEPKADFLIPDYQRPYAWADKECQTLWDDIFAFAFPDNDCDKFKKDNDEYFLGPIVTFKNEEGRLEIIDGQQRLTTLMLLLRAFYERYGHMMDDNALTTSKLIAQCIWKTDEFGNPDKTALKINSEVATDDEKSEFLDILTTGKADGKKSQYAQNYRFFQAKIDEFLKMYPSYFSFLPIRILNNCIMLPIEAESQDTALRIFSTLNDRGLPLSDADIFKAQFYKHYTAKGQKESFIKRWKDLEVLCNDLFHPVSGTPLDEIFTRYMYYQRSLEGNKSSTTEGLRKFYEKNNYHLLKNDQTLSNVIDLALFWKDVQQQNDERFSERVLRELFVLNYAPNSMWTYYLSVYYMANKTSDGKLNDEKLFAFLGQTIAFVFAYAITNPGMNSLRTPIFTEMVNIVTNKPLTFQGYLFERSSLETALNNYVFSNNRSITKSILTWWAFSDTDQELLPLDTVYEIEHIYPKSRQEKEHSLNDIRNLESLGNKAILEKRINIRASDYRFVDKIKYYTGYNGLTGRPKAGTRVHELLHLANTCKDFIEQDIAARHETIISSFIRYVGDKGLIKEWTGRSDTDDFGVYIYGKRPVVWSAFDGELTLAYSAADWLRVKLFSDSEDISRPITLLIDGKKYAGRIMNVKSSSSVQIAYGNEVKELFKNRFAKTFRYYESKRAEYAQSGIPTRKVPIPEWLHESIAVKTTSNDMVYKIELYSV